MVNPTDSGVTTISPKDFRKLKVMEMDQTGLTFIIGKRGTGKTRLVCDLAYNWYLNGMRCQRKMPDGTTQNYQRKLDMVVCFSPTELIKQDFKVFVPSAFRYPKFRENVVNDLVAKQKSVLEQEGGADKCQRVLMIIDDCAFEKGFFKTEIIRFIAMNLRHYNVHVIITVQYALDVPPAIRQNIDYCFCLHDNSNSNKKRYWEHFYGQIASQRDFNSIFDALTNDYSCMVGLNGVQSSTLTDTLFWYKGDVKLPSEFRMGRPAYWILSETTQIDRNGGQNGHGQNGQIGEQNAGQNEPNRVNTAAAGNALGGALVDKVATGWADPAQQNAPAMAHTLTPHRQEYNTREGRGDRGGDLRGDLRSNQGDQMRGNLQSNHRDAGKRAGSLPVLATSGSNHTFSVRDAYTETPPRATSRPFETRRSETARRSSSRTPFQHSGSSIVRRSHSSLPVEIVVTQS